MITVRPGMAIRHHEDPVEASGTIGAIVRRKDTVDDTLYVLSCSHVLAPFYQRPVVGEDAVITGNNVKVGTLLAHTLDRVGDDYVYSVDAALAVIDPTAVEVKTDIEGVGPITGRGRFRGLSMKAYVRGYNDARLQRGLIGEELVEGETIPFEVRGKKYFLRGVVMINAESKDFGNPGDSGSMILNRFGRALGLATFMATDANRRYFAPIELVLSDLERAARFPPNSLQLVTRPEPVDLERVYSVGGA